MGEAPQALLGTTTAGHRCARWVLACAIAVSILDGVAFAQQKSVLVLYATRRDAQIAVVGDRELPRVLEEGLRDSLDYYSEFLDQARLSLPEYQDAFGDFLKVKYSGHRFDLVMAMGDVPLGFVANLRQEIFGDAPVVFFSDRPVTRPPNATGFITTANFGDTVALAATLQPAARDVYVISGATSNDRALLDVARQQLSPFEQRLNIHYWSALPTRELETRLAALPANSIVYYILVDRDGDGVNVHPLEYIDRVIAASAAPVYCWVNSAMDRGIVGGSLKNQEAQTRALGALALRVLGGEPPDAIPIDTPDFNIRQVDWRQLRRWGISESRVPAGTVILHREPSVWDRYRWYIIGAVAVLAAQSALIGGLLVQRRRRRGAEVSLAKQQGELQESYDRIRDLGGRLLSAQEAERARIARELHDDINQQMVALGMHLEALGSSLAGEEAAQAHDAATRTRSIAKTIHDLSHRLHPARVQLLGLVPSLRGLQRELSHPDIEITLVYDDLPPLSRDLTLCLYRIVQEALQNAIAYSQGNLIAVELRRVDERVHLTITDDGIGFDQDVAWRKGLGLISMRERLEAVGGTLTIHSRPGGGTTLEVDVAMQQRLRSAV